MEVPPEDEVSTATEIIILCGLAAIVGGAYLVYRAVAAIFDL